MKIFLPTGADTFLGSLGPNQTPIPAVALVSPLSVQDPSVKATMFWGVLVLGSLLDLGIFTRVCEDS